MDQVFCDLYGAPYPACEEVRVSCNVEHTLPFNTKANTEWSYTDTALTYLIGVNIAMYFHHFLTAKLLDQFLNWHIVLFITRDAFYLHSILELYKGSD